MSDIAKRVYAIMDDLGIYMNDAGRQVRDLVTILVGEIATVTAERDKWLEAFNRSEQFQSGPTVRAERAEAYKHEFNPNDPAHCDACFKEGEARLRVGNVQTLDVTKLITREGWFCTSCGHRHAGHTLANICVGCSCPLTEPLGGTAEDDWIRIASQNAQDATARLEAVQKLYEQARDDQRIAAREELRRILVDYREASDTNDCEEWFWVDQIEDRIRALDLIVTPRQINAK